MSSSNPSSSGLWPWPVATDVNGFARLAGVEAVVRGSVLAAFPLLMYRAWGDAALVSQWYLTVGVLSLLTALLVPLLGRVLRRRRVYLLSVSLYLMAACLGCLGQAWTTTALLLHAIAAASSFVCFNAYVLDHVDKADYGRLESQRMFYGGWGWTLGPLLGVWSLQLWQGGPFVMLGLGALTMLYLIRAMPLSEARVHVSIKQRSLSHQPWVILRRFFSQPRLVAGWSFALLRSCGWWVYFVYVGIFAVKNGLGEQVGGWATSAANAGLFLSPLVLRWTQRHPLRRSLRGAFLVGAVCFLLSAVLSNWPWLTVLCLLIGALCLVTLDVCAGLPFMMAVKPSERTEMSAVYSSFRDFSGIVSPALAWLVLQFTNVAGVFAMGGVCLLAGWLLAAHLHPQLGVPPALRARARRSRAWGPAS